MPYTVKELAQLSGVSVRTLHFYDEIGLLKPAYYGDNSYRYYQEAQLLLLQQILFFRELGFQLNDIKRIISGSDFDQLKTLESHRKILKERLVQTKDLIKTLDKTIAHLRGEKQMKLEEIFEGFNDEKQAYYEDYLVDHGVNREAISESKRRVKHWTSDDWLKYKGEADSIHHELIAAINKGAEPWSKEVQALIKKHYDLITVFWIPNKETYIGLSQLYSSHPDFVKFYDDMHPELLTFLMEAMRIFAEQRLS